MYDIDVIGYENGVNKLHLFDVETVDESIVKKGIDFDKKAIKKNLTLFLYPDDSDKDGNLLRIYQEYFMCANAARLILKDMADILVCAPESARSGYSCAFYIFLIPDFQSI